MTKETFLRELENHLQRVPAAERKEIMYDYEEHFRIGFEEGKTEEEISLSLGNPETIANDLLPERKFIPKRSAASMVLIAIAMLFFNLVFVLGIAGGVLGAYVGLTAGAVALSIAPIIGFINTLVNDPQFLVFGFFSSLMSTSLGILWSIGMFYVGKGLWNVTVLYIKFNIRVVKGGN